MERQSLPPLPDPGRIPMMKQTVQSVALLTLAGCATVPRIDFTDPASIRSGIVSQYDQYRGIRTILGPFYEAGNPVASFFGARKRIAAIIGRKGVQMAYIELREVYHGDWKFYSSATDISGKKMTLIEVDKDVSCSSSGCSFREIVRMPVDFTYLEDNAERGIDIRVYGQRGSSRVFLPPLYVRTFHEHILSETGPQGCGPLTVCRPQPQIGYP